jgi:hypothetical protein
MTSSNRRSHSTDSAQRAATHRRESVTFEPARGWGFDRAHIGRRTGRRLPC